mmetsp:Transcript_60933/g.154820  ORF Transcript_60933/g.154820 Transcript_60933/m.154820 type:complete len:219 (+) Transcript_60933:568-1224(+)
MTNFLEMLGNAGTTCKQREARRGRSPRHSTGQLAINHALPLLLALHDASTPLLATRGTCPTYTSTLLSSGGATILQSGLRIRLRLACRFGLCCFGCHLRLRLWPRFRLGRRVRRRRITFWLRFRLRLRLGCRVLRQRLFSRGARSRGATEADVVHPEMQALMGPATVAVVEGVDADLGPEGLLQGIKRHRAGSEQRAIHNDDHFRVRVAGCKVECEVV